MRIDSRGHLIEESRIRAGFIGCVSHVFRNVYPARRFASVELVAVCDRLYGKVAAFARRLIRRLTAAVLNGWRLVKGTLEQAWQVTGIFAAFSEGPGRVISLKD